MCSRRQRHPHTSRSDATSCGIIKLLTISLKYREVVDKILYNAYLTKKREWVEGCESIDENKMRK